MGQVDAETLFLSIWPRCQTPNWAQGEVEGEEKLLKTTVPGESRTPSWVGMKRGGPNSVGPKFIQFEGIMNTRLGTGFGRGCAGEGPQSLSFTCFYIRLNRSPQPSQVPSTESSSQQRSLGREGLTLPPRASVSWGGI